MSECICRVHRRTRDVNECSEPSAYQCSAVPSKWRISRNRACGTGSALHHQHGTPGRSGEDTQQQQRRRRAPHRRCSQQAATANNRQRTRSRMTGQFRPCKIVIFSAALCLVDCDTALQQLKYRVVYSTSADCTESSYPCTGRDDHKPSLILE
jgi:hypothetical protein